MELKSALKAMVLAVLFAAITGPAVAEQKFVPKGHSYRPGNETLPPLNSRQDRVYNKADIYESEIYRKQRERAIQDAEMRRLIEHDLRGGTNFMPRY